MASDLQNDPAQGLDSHLKITGAERLPESSLSQKGLDKWTVGNVHWGSLLPFIEVSVMTRATAETASDWVAKSTPLATNWLRVDSMKLSGMMGVAINLYSRERNVLLQRKASIDQEHSPGRNAIHPYQPFPPETRHKSSNAVFSSGVNRRALRIDITHDARHQN